MSQHAAGRIGRIGGPNGPTDYPLVTGRSSDRVSVCAVPSEVSESDLEVILRSARLSGRYSHTDEAIQNRAKQILANDQVLKDANRVKQPHDVITSILHRLDQKHKFFNNQPYNVDAEAYWEAQTRLELYLGRYLFVFPTRAPFIRTKQEPDTFIFGGVRVKMTLDEEKLATNSLGDYPKMENLTMGEATIVGGAIRCVVPGWRDDQDVPISEFINVFEPLILHLG